MGLLVEQTTEICAGHRWRAFARPEPRQLQSGAVVVLRIGVARVLPGRDRPRAGAEIVADRAKRKPGGGEGRRKLHCSPQDFSGSNQIARGDAFDRQPILAVGRGVAGGGEERGTCHRAI
jgi:hypothetical protein